MVEFAIGIVVVLGVLAILPPILVMVGMLFESRGFWIFLGFCAFLFYVYPTWINPT